MRGCRAQARGFQARRVQVAGKVRQLLQSQNSAANLGRHRQPHSGRQSLRKNGRPLDLAMGAQTVILQVFHQRIEARTTIQVVPQRGAQLVNRFQPRRHPARAIRQMLPDLLVQKPVDDDRGEIEPLRSHLLDQRPGLAQPLIFGGGDQHEVDVRGMQQRFGLAQALNHAVHGLLGGGEELGNRGKHSCSGKPFQFTHHETRRPARQSHREAAGGKVGREQPSGHPRVEQAGQMGGRLDKLKRACGRRGIDHDQVELGARMQVIKLLQRGVGLGTRKLSG
ncbi:MAG TPA: hypothetical protein VGY99_14115 [Candidatus Binataceae bacterium]|nr:hypothetical protein [Candidatus Binataceae bacterium]